MRHCLKSVSSSETHVSSRPSEELARTSIDRIIFIFPRPIMAASSPTTQGVLPHLCAWSMFLFAAAMIQKIIEFIASSLQDRSYSICYCCCYSDCCIKIHPHYRHLRKGKTTTHRSSLNGQIPQLPTDRLLHNPPIDIIVLPARWYTYTFNYIYHVIVIEIETSIRLVVIGEEEEEEEVCIQRCHQAIVIQGILSTWFAVKDTQW